MFIKHPNKPNTSINLASVAGMKVVPSGYSLTKRSKELLKKKDDNKKLTQDEVKELETFVKGYQIKFFHNFAIGNKPHTTKWFFPTEKEAMDFHDDIVSGRLK